MRRYLVIVLRLALAAVFTYAAYSKLSQPWTIFALSVDSYQVLPEWAVLGVARTLPWSELALGLLLAIGIWLRYTSLAAAAVLGLFFVMMLIAYGRGLAIDCGCFGFGEALSVRTLARDGLLLAAAFTLAFLAARSRHPSAAR
jgi:uncharacterized membrane protein YphA (DoxX/SURF4 family)